MRVNRFFFSLFKWNLNRGGKIGLKNRPHFEDYVKYLDNPSDDSPLDSHRYDVILARPEKRNGITLIDIHGGAYVYSTRRHNHTWMHYFLERGFDIVILDYPLCTGKFGFDHQFEVVYGQVADLAKRKKEFGLGDRYFVTGDSAGGHFALYLAEVLTNPDLRKKAKLPEVDLPLEGVLLNCPVYDFRDSVGSPLLTNGTRKQMFGPKWKDKDYVALYDPRVHYSDLNLPVFLSSCKQDFINVNAKSLKEDADKLHKPLTYLYLDTDAKGVDHVHNLVRMDLPESKQVNDAMIAFMKGDTN